MSRATTIAALVGVLLTASAQAGPSAEFYWPSLEMELAIVDSDWGAKRGVEDASCRGVGAYKKQYGLYAFKRFRCELDNRNYDRIGFVTAWTVGPETWKTTSVVRPRCG